MISEEDAAEAQAVALDATSYAVAFTTSAHEGVRLAVGSLGAWTLYDVSEAPIEDHAFDSWRFRPQGK